ncbi:MAG TPA: RNA polymerase sigma-70 factor [Saprospiraceae bacterium]|nr:RNA polymerase sigma-70 factor [Saprospiraceae bacterium]HMQ83860.1 RNA polymerase sigma-70 factor [Saprospiraceae bacterium]
MSPSLTTDLLTRLKSDDKEALKELFESYYAVVCGVIRRYVPDPDTMEDLAQELFIRFWNKRHQIEINTSLVAYLQRMAVNEALAYLRRNKRFDLKEAPSEWIPIDMNSGGTEEKLLHQELNHQIKAAIDQLPPKCRTVFQLSRFEEFSYQQIADEMGISIKTVENQMGKALKMLRSSLKGYLKG